MGKLGIRLLYATSIIVLDREREREEREKERSALLTVDICRWLLPLTMATITVVHDGPE